MRQKGTVYVKGPVIWGLRRMAKKKNKKTIEPELKRVFKVNQNMWQNHKSACKPL